MKTDAGLIFVGRVRSRLKTLDQCPNQGSEGAPTARLEINPHFQSALNGIKPGSKIVILTWFDQADRTALQVHPRGNPNNPLTGVFLTRSPNRPNPVGLHEVRVIATVEDGILVAEPLEALDNTPIIDIKFSLPGIC